MSFGMIIWSQNRDKKNDDSEDKKKLRKTKKSALKRRLQKLPRE